MGRWSQVVLGACTVVITELSDLFCYGPCLVSVWIRASILLDIYEKKIQREGGAQLKQLKKVVTQKPINLPTIIQITGIGFK